MMNTKCNFINRPLLALLVVMSGTSICAFAAEGDCTADKVTKAKELDSGGLSKTALSEDDYKKTLGLEKVQVVNGLSKVYYEPDPTRLTVVQVSGKVTDFSCK